jgi:dihydrofolate synthase/folylpolyglutamate synthase
MQRRGRCRVRKTLTGLLPRLKGEYQRQNAGLALAAVELLADHGFAVSDEASRTGLSQVNWPGRLEYFTLPVRQKTPEDSRTYLLDGAHNPAGVASLAQALEQSFKYDKLILVWGAMADKDLAGTLPLIASLADRLVLTTPGGERSARPADLLKLLPGEKQPAAQCEETVSRALQRAVALAGPKDLICVAGSLYLVGAARRQLLGGLED